MEVTQGRSSCFKPQTSGTVNMQLLVKHRGYDTGDIAGPPKALYQSNDLSQISNQGIYTESDTPDP